MPRRRFRKYTPAPCEPAPPIAEFGPLGVATEPGLAPPVPLIAGVTVTRWSIRTKLLIGLGLLVVIVSTLGWGGIHGLYAYRSLVRSLSRRVLELPLATDLGSRVADLRVAYSRARDDRPRSTDSENMGEPLGALDVTAVAGIAEEANGVATRTHARGDEFQRRLADVDDALARYRQKLAENPDRTGRIGENDSEWKWVHEIEQTLAEIRNLSTGVNGKSVSGERLEQRLQELQLRTAQLPQFLHRRILEFSEDAKSQYRALIALSWITSLTSLIIGAILIGLFYHWLFRPLRILIKGSRKVAAGSFHYLIRLDTDDEMSELASAMNDMTARFREIRDDLDRQVRDRTKQVVRSEQLASVGYLAAGVAHEINNPLAAIALCAESLEGRLDDSRLATTEDRDLPRKYLRMIQDEAFRVKEITEKLLDFARGGDARRQPTELGELARGVVEMVGLLGKTQGKKIEFPPCPEVVCGVNPREIKQVVLNLLTNALDSLAEGGTVRIDVARENGWGELWVIDDGCGMTPDVLERLFEPFFTRRRGGQGTGLGLSISYRIVADHGGVIEATSPGVDRGSRFRVRLPLAEPAEALAQQEEHDHRHQAA